MVVRLAEQRELDQINRLRKEVNDLHVAGKPEFFKKGFTEELKDYIYEIWNDEKKDIVVAVIDDNIVGYGIVSQVHKKETPFMYERNYLYIDEFCVDENHRREGIASKLVDYIVEYAKEKGIQRIELNMWEFNEDALLFYEKVGFQTYRRYLEMEI